MTAAPKSVSASAPRLATTGDDGTVAGSGAPDAALGFLAELAAAGATLPKDQVDSLLSGLTGDALSAAKQQLAGGDAKTATATGHHGKKASFADLGLSQALLGSTFGAQVAATTATPTDAATLAALAGAVTPTVATPTTAAAAATPTATPTASVVAVGATTATPAPATAAATAAASTPVAATATAPAKPIDAQPATSHTAEATAAATPLATPDVSTGSAAGDNLAGKDDDTPKSGTQPAVATAEEARSLGGADLRPGHSASAEGAAQIIVAPEDAGASSAVAAAGAVGTQTVTQTNSTTQVGTTTTTTTVTQQVFPEITKAVASGTGNHRLVVTLHPQDLGEVRVTVVVRSNGDVRVDLSTDPTQGHAKDALIQGTSELRRMLESSGTNTATVTIRDLGTTMTGGDAGRQNQPFTAQFGANGDASGSQTGGQPGNGRQGNIPTPTQNPTSPDVSAETRRPEPGRAAGSVDQLI